jgi:hypothetical protein
VRREGYFLYHIGILHPPENQSDLDLMIIVSGPGHYPVDLGKKNPAGLDYFPGRFTFKATPTISVISGGIRKFPYRGVKRCYGKL